MLAQSKCWQALSGTSVRKLLQSGLKSRVPSTVKKYLREGILYQTFLRQHRLPEALPTSAERVSLYLSFLLKKNQASAVSMACSALRWIHGLLPIPSNPLDVGLCQKFVDAERRQRKTPFFKKQPASLELIKKIADTFAKESGTLKVLRIATMSVLSFAGLFRSKEFLNIRVCDVSLKDDHVKIHVPSSKTDVYRKGQDVFTSRSNTNACLCLLLDKYLQKANVTLNDSSDYLFRNLIYLKKTKQYNFREKGGVLY